MLFICYPKCATCQKAKKWLDEHNIEYTERHIVDANPTYDELVKVKSFAPRQIQRRLFAALITLSRKVFRPWHKWF